MQARSSACVHTSAANLQRLQWVHARYIQEFSGFDVSPDLKCLVESWADHQFAWQLLISIYWNPKMAAFHDTSLPPVPVGRGPFRSPTAVRRHSPVVYCVASGVVWCAV